MTAVIYALIIGILMSLAVGAALKLFDIGSDYSPIIRKICVPAGIVLSLIVVFFSVSNIVKEIKYDGGIFAAIVVASIFVLTLIGWTLSKTIDNIMNKKRKSKKETLPFLPLTAIDAFGGLIAGLAFSGFFFSSSVCYFAAVALALFLIIEKTAIVFRYQGKWSRKQIITNIVISLLAIPVVAAIVLAIVNGNYDALTILMAFGSGYLLYRSVYHLFFIVKSAKKS